MKPLARTAGAVLLVACATLATSCVGFLVDKDALQSRITAIVALHDSTVIGTGLGQVSQAEADALAAAIEEARAVDEAFFTTQAIVDEAVATLESAADRFAGAVVPALLQKSSGSAGILVGGTVTVNDYGSGTTVYPESTSDTTYSPCIQANSTTNALYVGGGPYCVVSFGMSEAVPMGNYGALVFKIRTVDFTTVTFFMNNDKAIGNSSPLAISDYARPIDTEWSQVRIPLEAIYSPMPDLSNIFMGFGVCRSDYVGKVRIADFGFSTIAGY